MVVRKNTLASKNVLGLLRSTALRSVFGSMVWGVRRIELQQSNVLLLILGRRLSTASSEAKTYRFRGNEAKCLPHDFYYSLSFVKMHTFNNPLIYPIHGLAITIFYTSSNRKFTITAVNQRKRVNGCGSASFFPVCVWSVVAFPVVVCVLGGEPITRTQMSGPN